MTWISTILHDFSYLLLASPTGMPNVVVAQEEEIRFAMSLRSFISADYIERNPPVAIFLKKWNCKYADLVLQLQNMDHHRWCISCPLPSTSCALNKSRHMCKTIVFTNQSIHCNANVLISPRSTTSQKILTQRQIFKRLERGLIDNTS